MSTQETLTAYKAIPLDKPFRILKKNKDATVWKRTEHGLLIYFHVEKFWINPPTESMESHALNAIERCGVEYLAEGEAL